eukprot:6373574-Pyramimonas_sp.AAC.1
MPHIGQCLVINGAIQYNMIRTLALPRTFSHPKLAKPLPNPDSKRQKKLSKQKVAKGQSKAQHESDQTTQKPARQPQVQ